MHLVQQLQGTGLGAEQAGRVVEQGDLRAAVGVHMRQWITEPGVVRGAQQGLPDRVEIATGQLPAAFEQVAHRNGTGQRGCPGLEVVHRGRRKQGRVGNAASHDHVGAVVERRRQRPGAKVGVGTEQLAHHRPHPGDLVVQVHHIIARHGRHAHAAATQLGRQLCDRLAGRARVGRAEVGDDPAAVGRSRRQQRREAAAQPRIGPGARIVGARLERRHQRAFGQAFEHHGVDLAGGGQRHRRLDAVAGKTGAGTDAADNSFGGSHRATAPCRNAARRGRAAGPRHAPLSGCHRARSHNRARTGAARCPRSAPPAAPTGPWF